MSADIKLYTERELIVAKREGWAIATCAGLANFAGNGHSYTTGPCDRCKVLAAQAYPPPKVTRARVVVEPGCGMAWKVVQDTLYFSLSAKPEHLGWRRCEPFTVEHEVTTARVRMWADLLLNPTEDVEE